MANKDWKNGSIKGLLARGGFKVDIEWKDSKLTKAKIYSRLGGNLRLRTYAPLSSENLKKANGKNPNNFYQLKEIPTPKFSDKITPKSSTAPKVYEYDILTKAGDIINITSAN